MTPGASAVLLSVCVPIFRQNPAPLARALAAQMKGLPVEVIFMDDGSGPGFEAHWQELAGMEGVTTQRQSSNLGRAAIRNRLAAAASGAYVLFLDGDSQLVSDHFLAGYLERLPFEGVVCGGRVYSDTAPPGKTLHHRYGRMRESRPAALRAKQPYLSFMTNNFLAPVAILQAIPFDERLGQYGHEDTLFGFWLKQNQIPVWHIDNAVLHAELETDAHFLHKTRQAIENLIFLQNALPSKVSIGFSQTVGLLRAANGIKSLSLARMFGVLFKWGRPFLERALTGRSRPSMFVFQLYKIGYFCALSSTRRA